MFNNNAIHTDFNRLVEEEKLKSERQKLAALQAKYPTLPDQSNTSLREDLEINWDLIKLKNLSQKFGVPQPWETNAQPTVNGTMGQAMPANVLDDTYLSNRMYDNIKQHEQMIDYPYYDTKWNLTAGAGKNVNDRDLFFNTAWYVNGRPATYDEILSGYTSLLNEKQNLQMNSLNPTANNYKASYFQKFSNLRLPEEEAKKIYTNHMLRDIRSIRTHIPNFDNLGVNTQNVIMDMMYNMGDTNFSQFTNFIGHAKNNDILGMIGECNRKDVPQSRNDWARQQLRLDL